MTHVNALRECLLPPIPEVLEAATLLGRAADAVSRNDVAAAAEFISNANIRAVWRHVRRVMGRYDDDIHRYRRYEPPQWLPPRQRVRGRMPGAEAILTVFRRDGFRCRYCSIPVIIPAARKIMMTAVPDVLPWPDKDDDKHAGFYALTAVVDHVVPHARGGANDPHNLVTACQGCNYGKGNYLLEELDLLDPREREPVCDAWDGLLRLVTKNPDRPHGKARLVPVLADGSSPPQTSEPRAKKPRADPVSLESFQPAHAAQLAQLLERSVSAGAIWKLNKALIVKIPAKDACLDVVGINQDGTVEVPWMLDRYKAPFRHFADRLAAALDGSEVYQTSKGWWRVRRHGRRLTVAELLQASDALVEAIVDFRAAIDAESAIALSGDKPGRDGPSEPIKA